MREVRRRVVCDDGAKTDFGNGENTLVRSKSTRVATPAEVGRDTLHSCGTGDSLLIHDSHREESVMRPLDR